MLIEPSELARRRDELGLRTDCSRCFGLCCVGLSLKVSADFAISKPSGRPCPNLLADFGCGIHADLRERGFAGCTTYDCFGAGNKVAQVMFGGRDWRSNPETAQQMFQTLPPLRELHQLLWFLTEALSRTPDGPESDQLLLVLQDTVNRSNGRADELSWSGVDQHARMVLTLLDQVSARVRTEARALPERPGPDFRGADLRAADLAGRDLRGADFRGADLLDADLRRADVAGADLESALFLTQGQLNSAYGDGATTFPPGLESPSHWTHRDVAAD